MTCIAGLEHEGKVWIGGDSAGVAGFHSLTVRADEKVWTSAPPEPMVFGFTSSFRMGQILRYQLTLPPARHEVEKDADAEFDFMVATFVEKVKAELTEHGYATTENGQVTGGHFLVGWRGRLYTIESDFQVARAVAPFAAVGCGDNIAHGVLYALEKENLIGKAASYTPTAAVRLALEAAEAMNAGVRGPFKVVCA